MCAKKTTELFYSNVTEFCDAVKSGQHGLNANSWNEFANYKDIDWFGLAGAKAENENIFQATQRLIENGWTAGADLMSQVQNVIVPAATDIRRRMVWTDNGDEIEMQRVYAGNLDTCWRRTRRVSVNGPVRVRIAVDSLAHASVDSLAMRWRGVAAMRLADALTEAGYLVEIESAFSGVSTKPTLGTVIPRVVVKAYSDPINLPVLAACTALPAFFRSHGHLLHLVAAANIGQRLGYVSYNVTPLLKEHIPADKAERLFIAPQTISNAASANEWLAKCMAEIEAGINEVEPE